MVICCRIIPCDPMTSACLEVSDRLGWAEGDPCASPWLTPFLETFDNAVAAPWPSWLASNAFRKPLESP